MLNVFRWLEDRRHLRRLQNDPIWDPLLAIRWATEECPHGEERIFLKDWNHGDLDDWLDYREWVTLQQVGRSNTAPYLPKAA